MADFDQIKNTVLEYADRYAQAFRQGAPRDTGRLANPYRASVSENGGKFTMQIFGEFYGPFQSYGVGPARPAIQVPNGVNPPPLSGGGTYKFKNPNRYIPATNFMGNAITNLTPKFGKELEAAGVKDIENFFDSLSKIEVE